MLFASLADRLLPRIFLDADTGDSGASTTDESTATTDGAESDDSFGAGLDEAAAALETSSASEGAETTEGAASSPGITQDRDGAEGTTAAQQQAFSALEYARSQGVDFGYANDQEFTRDAVAAMQMLRQRQSDLQLAQQIRPYLPQFQQFMAAQQQPQQGKPAAQEVAEKKRWIEALENDPTLYRMVETDPETGSLRAKSGYDPGVVAKIMNNQSQMQARAEQWLTDPAKFLDPFKAETVQEAVEKAVEMVEAKYFNQINANLQARDILDRSSSWMYTPDRSAYTPEGRRYIQILQNLDAVGIRDPRQADEVARNMLQQERMHYSQFGQAPQQQMPGGQPQPQNPSQQAQAAKANFVKKGQRTPNLGNRASRLGDDSEGLSLAEMSARALAHATAN